MSENQMRPMNQTVDELLDEYIGSLEHYIDTFAMTYGYMPKDPEGFDYPFSPPEVQEMSWKFWNDPHIMKLDTLANLFEEIVRRL